MTISIRLFRESDIARWDQYVIHHKNGTFFHMTGWKSLVEKVFGHPSHYLIAEVTEAGDTPGEDDTLPSIAGVFPLFSLSSVLFGKNMISIPFASYGGILADNEQISNTLLDKAADLTRNWDLEYLEIRNENKPLSGLVSKDLYYVFKREITPDHDENLKAIPRKARRMVRVGIKNDLQASFGRTELLDPFYNLLASNYHRLGTPVFSKHYIRCILREFKDNCSILLISTKTGKALCGVLNFYYKEQVIPYYSGAVPESNKYAANDFMYWALLCDAAEKGYRTFDFGRSKKDTGPYHFKRHWGFEPRQLYYQYYLNTLNEIPNVSPSNPKYKRRIEAWKKLPVQVTKLIGPLISKYTA